VTKTSHSAIFIVEIDIDLSVTNHTVTMVIAAGTANGRNAWMRTTDGSGY
jgi:hypothetical protein